ncbi:ABC transporter ATP-binding protein [Neisseria meningitidis]|nr:ABC transporter ATP-binding protein [Neisseria meningitidis]
MSLRHIRFFSGKIQLFFNLSLDDLCPFHPVSDKGRLKTFSHESKLKT